MATIYKVDCPNRKPLFEGVQGENEARSIQFDITPWVDELGDGAVTATAKRPQDSQPYPVTVTKVGNIVTWKPTSTDTAYEGVGSFQLEYTVGGVIAKTCIWSTQIAPSLDPAGDPPDPYDNWLAEMRQVAADALQSEQNAEDSAEDAEAWAKGTKNGTPVSSSDAQYQNNAKYFAEESYKNAEAWAVGQRGGVDVPSTDPTYHNNAKYYAEQSAENQYGAFIVKSASGGIASFNDGADDVPMKSLNVQIVPKQAGSGDPSPDNVRAITGWTDADVTVTTVNLYDYNEDISANNFYIKDDGTTVTSANYSTSDYIKIKPNTFYYWAINGVPANPLATHQSPRFAYYDENKNWLVSSGTLGEVGTYLQSPANAKYIRVPVYIATAMPTAMLVEGKTIPAEFTPFGHTTPVPLGQTVYGGEVDVVSGECKAWIRYDLGNLTWAMANTNIFYCDPPHVLKPAASSSTAFNAYCEVLKPASYNETYNNHIMNTIACNSGTRIWAVAEASSATAFKSIVNGHYLVAELDNPAPFTTTPVSVPSLLGTNNVWSDAGSVEVEYRADPTLAYNELANVIVSLGGNL